MQKVYRFTRKFFNIYPKFRTVFYTYWNRLFFTLIGVKYGKNLCVRNKVYIIGRGRLSENSDITI